MTNGLTTCCPWLQQPVTFIVPPTYLRHCASYCILPTLNTFISLHIAFHVFFDGLTKAYDMMPDGGFGPGDQTMYSNDTPRYHNPGFVSGHLPTGPDAQRCIKIFHILPGQVVHGGVDGDTNAQALNDADDKR